MKRAAVLSKSAKVGCARALLVSAELRTLAPAGSRP